MHEATHLPCRVATDDVAALVLPDALASQFVDATAFCQGQVGTGYRVRSAKTGATGLLKLVSDAAAGQDAERTRLKRELRKQVTIDHEALARIIDGGETDGRLWLFREYIPGESLRLRLAREGRLAVPEALSIASQVALALDELHRVGLLHRDLKPGHIIVAPAEPSEPAEPGEPRHPRISVIDASLSARHEGMFELRGTPSYMSPEQAAGQLCSYRSDLYALGCVLHEMLTGKPPFEGDLDEVLKAHRDTVPEVPKVELSDAVARLLTQLLHKAPRQRPFSAKQVWRVLRGELPASSPVPARRKTSTAVSAPISPPVVSAGLGDSPGSTAPPLPPSRRSSAPSTRSSGPPAVPRRKDHRHEATQELSIGDLVPATGATQRAVAAPAPRVGETTQELSVGDLSKLAVDGSFPPEEDTQELYTKELSQLTVDRNLAADFAREDDTQALDSRDLSRIALDEAVSGVMGGTSDDVSRPPPLPGASASETEAAPVAGTHDSGPAGEDPAGAPASDDAGGLASDPDAFDLADGDGGDIVAPHGSGWAMGDPGAAVDEDGAVIAAGAPGGSPVGTDAAAGEGASVERASAEIASDDAGPGPSPAKVTFDVESLFADESQAITGVQPPGGAPLVQGVAGEEAAGDSTANAGPDVDDPDELPTTAYDRGEVAAAVGASAVGASAVGAEPAAAKPERSWLGGRAGWSALAVLALLAMVLWWMGRQAAPPSEPSASPTSASPAPASPTSPPPTSPPPTSPPLTSPPPTSPPSTSPPPPTPAAAATAEAPSAANSPSVVAGEPSAPTDATGQPDNAAGDPLPTEAVAEAPPGGTPTTAPEDAAQAAAPTGKPRQATSAPTKTADQHKDEARAHYRAKRYAKAAIAYQRATNASPGDAGAFAGLGASRLGMGQVHRAVRAYRRAVALKPKVSGFHAALGRAHYQAGARKRAIAAYRRALALDPDNGAARAALTHLGAKP